eukprot:6187023-Pleurochrysis_carterae.AAC.2
MLACVPSHALVAANGAPAQLLVSSVVESQQGRYSQFVNVHLRCACDRRSATVLATSALSNSSKTEANFWVNTANNAAVREVRERRCVFGRSLTSSFQAPHTLHL